MIGDKCEFHARRGNKLLRCTNRATQSIDIQGEVVYLCVWHAATITRSLAKKARFEKQYQKLMAEIQQQEDEFMDNWRQGKQGGYNWTI